MGEAGLEDRIARLKREKYDLEMENEQIADKVEQIHKAHLDIGYRRIRDELDKNHGIHVNDKRVLHIDRALHIQSTIKLRRHGCTRSAKAPEYIAKNYLIRQFHADTSNLKWLTDIKEFKYYIGPEIHKIYYTSRIKIATCHFVTGSKPKSLFLFTVLLTGSTAQYQGWGVLCETIARRLYHGS